jgi:hypothetical protein
MAFITRYLNDNAPKVYLHSGALDMETKTTYKYKINMKDNKTTQSKFNIQKINGVDTLHINNDPVDCIYKTPVMLPHPQIQGQAMIIKPICSSNCPMFNLTPGLFGKLTFECTKTTIEIYTLTPLE